MKILAFDMGTSSVRAAIYNPACDYAETPIGQVRLTVQRPSPAAALLDPQAVLAATRTLLGCALDELAKSGQSEVTVAASAFWHSLMGVDAEGAVVTPCWIWEDAQSSGVAAELRADPAWEATHQATGAPIASTFWPARLLWLRRSEPGLIARVARWVSLPDWVFGQLGLQDPAATSISMASGTGLLDRHAGQWSGDLCQTLQITSAQLPAIAARSQTFHSTHRTLTAHTLPPIGDGAAGTLGSGVLPGARVLALNYGTSAAVRRMGATLAGAVPPGLFEYRLDASRTILGGAISNAGNLWHWAQTTLSLPGEEELERRLASRPGPVPGLRVAPFLAGERTPFWDGSLTGSILGLELTHTPMDLLQALQEATFYRLRGIADALDPATECEVVVSGGLSRSPASVQRLANILARPVRLLEEAELSLRGAALFGAQVMGLPTPDARWGVTCQPQPELVAQYGQARARHLEVTKE